MGSVLVAGAAGFVGTALARALMKDSRVVSMVRDRTSDPSGHVVVYGDIRDADFCRRVLADYEVETVYHLAAQSIVSVCAEDPVTALDIAVLGTARLLQAVRDTERPIRVVCMTSDKVYGSAPPPYTETTPLDARHAYEVSKACQDLVARMFHSNYELDIRVVRAVNIYGPGDTNESRLIPQTIQRCLAGVPPIIHEGAGGMRRQYIYIDDMVAALRSVLVAGRPGGIYCIGSLDAPLSVVEVMRQIAESAAHYNRGDLGPAPVDVPRDARFHEIESQAVDDSRTRKALGWAPKVTFAEGISRTVAHHHSRSRL